VPITPRLVGVTLRNFTKRRDPRDRRDNLGTSVGRGASNKIWEVKNV